MAVGVRQDLLQAHYISSLIVVILNLHVAAVPSAVNDDFWVVCIMVMIMVIRLLPDFAVFRFIDHLVVPPVEISVDLSFDG